MPCCAAGPPLSAVSGMNMSRLHVCMLGWAAGARTLVRGLHQPPSLCRNSLQQPAHRMLHARQSPAACCEQYCMLGCGQRAQARTYRTTWSHARKPPPASASPCAVAPIARVRPGAAAGMRLCSPSLTGLALPEKTRKRVCKCCEAWARSMFCLKASLLLLGDSTGLLGMTPLACTPLLLLLEGGFRVSWNVADARMTGCETVKQKQPPLCQGKEQGACRSQQLLDCVRWGGSWP